jgi:hypothetical protein
MPLLGQASGGWTESSSALRILNVGIRNTVGVLSDDSFTQTNPTAVLTNVTTRVDTTLRGVLSGSVSFCRPDVGSNIIGGPGDNAVQTAIQGDAALVVGYSPLGVFINSANGNAYENIPGVASGKGPYVSSQGTYGNALYETLAIGESVGAAIAAGTALVYTNGMRLISSRNGFLMPAEQETGGAVESMDDVEVTAESFVRNTDNSSTRLAILKMPPDSVQTELVYDQRI